MTLRLFLSVALLLVVLAPAQRLSAQRSIPPVEDLRAIPVRDDVRALIAALDSTSWIERQNAAARLRGMEIPNEQILAALAVGGLEDEQQHRLVSIARDRFIGMPRGALGIRMEQRFNQVESGVKIVALLPGMPAERELEIGDRIVAIDGRPVPDSSALIEIVQMKRPGEVIRLTLARPKRGPEGREIIDELGRTVFTPVEATLELASADELEAFPNGQVPGPNDPIARLRADQARTTSMLFTPRPVAVPIQDRRLTVFDQESVEVDDHQSVATLKTFRKMIEEGSLKISPQLRARWRSELRMLQEQSEAPDLDPEIRQYLRAVIRRYRELVPERGLLPAETTPPPVLRPNRLETVPTERPPR